MTKKYNTNSPDYGSGKMFDPTMKNMDQLNELEYGLFNQTAMDIAKAMLKGGERLPSLSGKSPDFLKRVGEWTTELQNQTNRKQSRDFNQPRDQESGRYVPTGNVLFDNLAEREANEPSEPHEEPQGEPMDVLEAAEAHVARIKAERARTAPVHPDQTLKPGYRWHWDGKANSPVTMVPDIKKPTNQEYEPGHGGMTPGITQPGNMSFVDAYAKKGGK